MTSTTISTKKISEREDPEGLYVILKRLDTAIAYRTFVPTLRGKQV